MTSESVKLERFGVLWRKQHKIKLAVARQFSSLQPDLSTRGPKTCYFMGALPNTSMNFSFAIIKYSRNLCRM